MTRRSTETITVLAFLSLTTVPCRTRLGISLLLYPRAAFFAGAFLAAVFFATGLAAAGLAATGAFTDAFWPRNVSTRAMSRRTARTRAVFSSWPLARWKRRLNASFFSWSSVLTRNSSAFIALLLLVARDDARLDRQLGGGQLEGFHRQVLLHAVDLEHDAARMDARHPVFRRPLARAHADFGGLAADRHVREHADPDLADALHMAGDRAARRLDLARGDPARLDGLQSIGAEVQLEAALRLAVDPALVSLPELGSLRRKHGPNSSLARGLSFGGPLVGSQRVVRHDLALEHPNLHAAGAVGRLRRRLAEIDLGAQRVQRNAALAVPLHTGDFGTAQTAAAVDADAERAQTHRRLHRALHGAAERDAALELLRDVLGDQLGVDLGLADLDDVQAHFRAGHLGEVAAELLDVRALLADHHARTRRVDGDAGLLRRALDDDLRDAGLGQTIAQIFLQLQVLVEELRIVAAGEPAAVPGPVDTDPEADRIDLLTHYFVSSAASARSRTITVRLLHFFSMRTPRPLARAAKRFSLKLPPTKASATTRRSTSS